MISVILYGRNDAHGYNLHKRAAISINCIAEMLSAKDDEIIFVDYNTPDDLPTFIEAIYDTLTDRARARLRALRVRPELHARLHGKRTHLAALEAISRNIAIRRSDSGNRWVLSTNTDMILVPRTDVVDLTTATADLADGHYVIPRFSLPEPLWETFSRQDPRGVIRACDELGRALHLNEVTAGHHYMRFDNPGDFQLIPRQTLFEICGFDERMIHGWHCDSNMCRRLYLLFGHTDSLAHRLKGYHCDHTRVTTLAHRLDLKLENDLNQFVIEVSHPVASHQTSSWGAPEETIEEVDFAKGPAARFAGALRATLGAPQDGDYHADANELRNYVSYQPEHVLPYVAAALTTSPRGVRLLYVGNNPRTLGLLATCVAELGFLEPVRCLGDVLTTQAAVIDPRLVTVSGEGEAGSRRLVEIHDILIFDFGLDGAALGGASAARITDWPRPLRYSLGAVARRLEACAERCHDLAQAHPGRPLPDFVVINASHHVFDQFASQFILSTQAPYTARVRKGRARLGEERLYRSHRWQITEEAMQSFFGYDAQGSSVPTVSPGSGLDLTSLARSSGCKDGHWGAADFSGTWIDGRRAVILFSVDPSVDTDLVAHVDITETFLGPDEEPVRVEAWFEGKPVGSWMSAFRYTPHTSRVVLPQQLFSRTPVVRLAFEVDNPHSVAEVARRRGEQTVGEDPRELSIKVHRIGFTGLEALRYGLGATADFTVGGAGSRYATENWSPPDEFGTWTIGPEASLAMDLDRIPDVPVVATFFINDAARNQEHPDVGVEVAFNGDKVAEWTVRSRGVEVRRAVVLPELLRRCRPCRISFRIRTPRSPADLGWSGDRQPLGVRLNRFHAEPLVVRSYRTGETIDFTEQGNAGPFLESGWSGPDQYGCWTVDREAILQLRLDPRPSAPMPISFLVSDCMVDGSAPALDVRVLANGRTVAEWTMGPKRSSHQRTAVIPPDVIGADGSVAITFQIATPRSPASLGWSTDDRPLGIRLTTARVGGGRLPQYPPFDGPRSLARRILARTRRAFSAGPGGSSGSGGQAPTGVQ